MEDRIKYLIQTRVITEEDGRILLHIATKNIEEGVSLLELITLKKRLEKHYQQSTNDNKDKLYLGLINLVEEYTEEWGSKSGVQYCIMG